MRPFLTRMKRVVRTLARTPLFTSVAVLTLAVGIGANTAIFTVVYGVLLKPLPFDEPERLVGLWHTAPGLGFDHGLNQSPAFHFTYEDENRSFENLGMWSYGSAAITGRGEPERVQALRVTHGILDSIRVRPIYGRRFGANDDQPGGPATVILTYAYWQRRFAGNPAAIGQGLTIDGNPTEIVGVLPAGFRFLDADPMLLLPIRLNRAEVFVGNFSYRGVARLRPGVTLAQANADVARMIPHSMDKFPMPPGFSRDMLQAIRMGPDVRPLSQDIIGEVSRVLWVVFGTVAIVLLIACANVANLFLVRAEGKQQELAVRSAMGATRGRLARELLLESVTLALVAGVVGVALAYAGLRLLAWLAPSGLPRLDEIAINPLVLLFTLAISLLSGALFGLIPILRFAPRRLANALKEGGRASSDGRERHRMRNLLVVAEVALALVLLVGSGLMIRTFQALRHVQAGFVNPEEVLTFRVSVPNTLVTDDVQAARTHEQIVRRLEQIPGVRSVGVSTSITMDGFDSNNPVFVEDAPLPPGRMAPIRRYKSIGERYFETMGNPMVAGRALTWKDAYAQANVVVVSENFAREYFKQPARALGKRVRESPTSPWREIVGVVGNDLDDGVAQKPPLTIYWPLLVKDFFGERMAARRNLGYVVRSGRLNSPTFLKEIQSAVWSVNPSLPLASVRTLDELRSRSMAQTSFALVMLGIAGAIALLLGVVGIYGVIACGAAQRTREIGIRVALGAQGADVSRMFVRHGLILAGVGIVLGLGAAAAATRVMATLLFGISAMDPVTYVAVAVGLAVVALVASYLPARRASRVDPVIALRAEA